MGKPIGGKWLADVVCPMYAREITIFKGCVCDRMLRSFDTLHEEVQRKAQEVFRSCSLADGEDPSSAAEWAQDEAFEWGCSVGAFFLGATALFTAGLFHLFEQQAGRFQESIEHSPRPSDRQGVELGVENLTGWLAKHGISCTSFPEWQRINELRHVANVSKHAEGRSASQLRALRPDLFELPETLLPQGLRGVMVARSPLAGDGLYIPEGQFKTYADTLHSFWLWLAECLGEHP